MFHLIRPKRLWFIFLSISTILFFLLAQFSFTTVKTFINNFTFLNYFNSSYLSTFISSSGSFPLAKTNTELAEIVSDSTCITNFMSEHLKYCTEKLQPHRNGTKICPCIPQTLVGLVKINETSPSLEEMASSYDKLEEDGHWQPSWCTARQRLAIIVPFANRDEHLRIFLNHMHPFLQRQLLDYKIFIIEQLSPELFNRAMLMNVGFVEANLTDDSFECFIFHDIDQLPIDDRNFYTCSDFPRHVVGYRKKFNYSYAYKTSFGGGNSFKREQFQLINGFSNQFYGWGGEDDDLYQRTEAKSLKRMRYPRCIAKYDEITHERDKRNPMGANQQLGFKFRPDVYAVDGLTNLNYTVLKRIHTKLFTKISVSLPPPRVIQNMANPSSSETIIKVVAALLCFGHVSIKQL